MGKNNLFTHTLVSKEGIPLGPCRKRKSEWYIKQGLAEDIGNNIIRLKFDIDGKIEPLKYENDDLHSCYSCHKKNINTLSNIVPKDYSLLMKRQYNMKIFNDLVSLCSECLTDYEKHIIKLRRELFDELDEKHCVQLKTPLFAIKENEYIDIHDPKNIIKIENARSELDRYKKKKKEGNEKNAAIVLQYMSKMLNKKFTEDDVDKMSAYFIKASTLVVSKYHEKGKLQDLSQRWKTEFEKFCSSIEYESDDDEPKIDPKDDSYILPLTDAEDD